MSENLSYRFSLSTDESRMAWITVPEDLTHAEAARLITVIMATVDLIVAAGGDADTPCVEDMDAAGNVAAWLPALLGSWAATCGGDEP